MRSKYEQETFAVYQGKIFTAYTRDDCFVRLRSYDVDDISKYGFTPFTSKDKELKGLKDVSPYEVTEYYEQRFNAKYRGVPVSIICGNDEGVDIFTYGDGDHEKMIKLGFEVPGRGEYLKSRVPISELTDVVCIKKNLLEYAKEDYDEEHPGEKE